MPPIFRVFQIQVPLWIYKPYNKTHIFCASVKFSFFKPNTKNSQFLCVDRVFTNPVQKLTIPVRQSIFYKPYTKIHNFCAFGRVFPNPIQKFTISAHLLNFTLKFTTPVRYSRLYKPYTRIHTYL